MKMIKMTVILLSAISIVSAWEDHPDRDEDRRDEGCNSGQGCDTGSYDWSKRDPEGNDRNESGGQLGGTHTRIEDK